MKSCVTISLVTEARGGPFVFWDDLAGSCRRAGELGYDAVEIFAPGPDAVDRPLVKRLLADHNLLCGAVGTGAGWVKEKLHLALPEESQRRRSRDFIKAMIEFGATFGAPAIIGSMQGRTSSDVDAPTARGYLADALEELGEHAKKHGVPLLFEPINRYETDQVRSVGEGLALLDRLSTKSVLLLCDLFHMNIEEIDVAASLRQAGPRVGHVHFVDSNRRPVGNGHLVMRPIIDALREIGYAGCLSAEALPWPNPDGAAVQTIKACRYWAS
jgi:sugar phosphate isomerase/epimerase